LRYSEAFLIFIKVAGGKVESSDIINFFASSKFLFLLAASSSSFLAFSTFLWCSLTQNF